MDRIFMNSENSKTSEPHVLILKITDKLDLRIGKKGIHLPNLSIYYIWKNIKIYAIKFELPDGSYSVSDIQNYFEYILLYVNKIKNMFTFLRLKLKMGTVLNF